MVFLHGADMTAQSKTPWTSGPLRYNPQTRYLTGPPTKDHPHGYVIAHFMAGPGRATNADGLLYEAAPEMAELLGDIGQWLEAALTRGQISRGTANRDGDLVTQIRALLARIGAP